MRPILALAAVITFTAAQAHAVPCPDWTSDRPGSDFWRTATVADVAGCIGAGAEVEARNKYGMTPLHMAAWHNKNPAVAAALLEAGANPRAKANNGKMPIDYAMDNEALKGSKVYWRLNDARFGD